MTGLGHQGHCQICQSLWLDQVSQIQMILTESIFFAEIRNHYDSFVTLDNSGISTICPAGATAVQVGKDLLSYIELMMKIFI